MTGGGRIRDCAAGLRHRAGLLKRDFLDVIEQYEVFVGVGDVSNLVRLDFSNGRIAMGPGDAIGARRVERVYLADRSIASTVKEDTCTQERVIHLRLHA